MSVLFAHFDIEADGPSPAFNNMISIGIVFTNTDGKVVDEFLGDFKPLLNHPEDADTMKHFWYRDENNRAELKRIQENAKDAMETMDDLNNFLKKLKAKRINWVARPAAYDWQWLNYYFHLYKNENPKAIPIGFKAICARTMRDVYQAQFGVGRKEMEKIAKKWAGDESMTHNPLDDARFQAKVYHALYNELLNSKK